MENIVRIEELEIEGIKNVKYGKLTFQELASYLKGDFEKVHPVLGIYGQNGSGKTAIIEVVNIIKELLCGNELDSKYLNYINNETLYSKISVTFFLSLNEDQYLIKYQFKFIKDEGDKLYISNENLSYRYFDKEKNQFTRYREIISIENNQLHSSNIKLIKSLTKEDVIKINLTSEILQNKSSFFNEHNLKLFNSKNNNSLLAIILNELHQYALKRLIIIGNEYLGNLSLNKFMPLNIYLKDQDNIIYQDLVLNLLEPSLISKPAFNALTKSIKEVNLVLNSIIPNLNIKIANEKEQLTSNGEEGVNFEIVTYRDDKLIPLKYESEGIKKIISVTCALIACYNNSSICLLIDEFDAGIFEYLLGELLSIIESDGKGQLIFTSHNLRPLEKLDLRSIIFTTTQKNNRYIKLTKFKNRCNLRDAYMREIILSDNNLLYEETNNYKIKRAFKMAGKIDE